jgi:hypothetical protein
VLLGLNGLVLSFQQAMKRRDVALRVTWRLVLSKLDEVCFQLSSRAEPRNCV